MESTTPGDDQHDWEFSVSASPSERTEKNPEAQKRGSKGGKKGGVKRAENLTDRERTKSATIAALARWKKGR